MVEGVGGPGAAPRRRRGRRPGPAASASRTLIAPLRYPEAGFSDDDAVEVRRIKARIDSERLPRGADPHTHLKLGRGGLADIEWTVQLLQMRYAGAVPGLRTSRTLEALAAAREAGLVDEDDAAILQQAWRTGQPGAQRGDAGAGQARRRAAPRRAERAAVASILGYPDRVLGRDAQRPAALHPARADRRGPDLLGVGGQWAYSVVMSSMR